MKLLQLEKIVKDMISVLSNSVVSGQGKEELKNIQEYINSCNVPELVIEEVVLEKKNTPVK